MNKLFVGLLLTLFISTFAYATIKQSGTGPVVESEHSVIYIMNGQISTGAGETITIYPGARTFHAKVVGTGAVTATVIIQVSNDGTTWIDTTTSPHIALSGTTSDADGFSMIAKWSYVRAYVNAITGDGWTALIVASLYGHIDIVALLLKQPGIDVNVQNNEGKTALDEANYMPEVQEILKRHRRLEVGLPLAEKKIPLGK